jgi:hypothetical protein
MRGKWSNMGWRKATASGGAVSRASSRDDLSPRTQTVPAGIYISTFIFVLNTRAVEYPNQISEGKTWDEF